ncbi:receptor-interacting serine/threonine-protein kinase 1-like, partial [Saccoglossus kowalevskii]|uniref:Receptor-interacting serine/threonine-protein kinase 1-like n=1 Tax=Saccoglossus kowalevskii TaxID=10224 RepID=A0ABM0ME48_SACKO
MAAKDSSTLTGEGLYVIDIDKVTNEEYLDKGSFGMVYKALHDDWGEVVVKRIFENTDVSESERKEMVEEAKKMSEVRSAHIVMLYGVIAHPSQYSLVIEYMCYGSLNNFQSKYRIPWALKAQMVHHIILGMNYLHKTAKIVHRDLKIDNVLVGKGFQVKVADFGLAVWRTYSRKYVKKRSRRSKGTSGAGTITHIPPEHLKNVNLRTEFTFDVYSFGITLWEMFTEHIPYRNAINSAHIFNAIENGQRPDIELVPSECPEFLKQMMEDCWHGDPVRRPSFGALKITIEAKWKAEFASKIHDAEMDVQNQIKIRKLKLEGTTSTGKGVYQPEDGDQMKSLTSKMTKVSFATPIRTEEGDLAEDGDPKNNSKSDSKSSDMSYRDPVPETQPKGSYRPFSQKPATDAVAEGKDQKSQGVPPQGVSSVPPQGVHGVPPQGIHGVPPQGVHGVPPQGVQGVPPQGVQGVPGTYTYPQVFYPQYYQAPPINVYKYGTGEGTSAIHITGSKGVQIGNQNVMYVGSKESEQKPNMQRSKQEEKAVIKVT